MKTKRFLGLTLLLMISGSLTTSCGEQISEPLPEPSDENSEYIEQNPDVLTGSDGRIVSQSPLTVSGVDPETTEIFRIRYLSDGLEVVGFVIKPNDDRSDHPVIIYNRGGNREFGKISYDDLSYLADLASANFVILASQYRGNDGGEGREEFGGDDVHDVLNLVPLAKSLSFTDSNNMVMLGFSRGGMMTYLALKAGADIRAAAVVGGITDLFQMYEERGDDMKQVLIDLIGGDPTAKESEYRSRSAYYWPERITLPVLILHGADDWRVNPTQAEKLADKLSEHGSTYELVVFPGGDHSLDTHAHERDREILQWFSNHLSPASSRF
jgi:dipeptidyl aminopeptidase/acylaminoacyl peptidase